MIKKIILSMMLLVSLTAAAQSTGNWKMHPIFVGSDVTNVVDAVDKVYYLASGNLFCYDKATKTNTAINKRNKLNDVNITCMAYDYTDNLLVLGYLNSNVDIITADGQVHNQPQLKDAVLTYSKSINSINCGRDYIFLNTSFGLVILDKANNYQVKEMQSYSYKIYDTNQVGDYIIVSGYGNTLVWYSKATADKSARTTNPGSRGTAGGYGTITPIDDTHFFCKRSGALLRVTMTISGSTVTFTEETLVSATCNNVQPTPSGFIANFKSGSYYYTFDSDGLNGTKVTASAELYSSHPNGDGTIWAVGASGVHVKGSSTYYKPDGLSYSTPYWLAYNKPLNRMYVSNSGPNYISITSYAKSNYVNYYNGSSWVTANNGGAHGNFGCGWLAMDPNDSTTYVQTSYTAGIHVVQNDKKIFTYNAKTIPVTSITSRPNTTFDADGNLWVCTSFNNSDELGFVLPAAKFAAHKTKKAGTSSDWVTFKMSNVNLSVYQQNQLIVANKQKVLVFSPGDYTNPVFFVDASDPTNTSPTVKSYSSFTDDTDQTFDWRYTYEVVEDKEGEVWIGHSEGVYALNPRDALGDDFRVRRMKLSSGALLCEGVAVYGIAVDDDNNKWIATNTAGLLKVNPDGTEILQEFTTANSLLPSNTVYQVEYNPTTKSIFVTTPSGVYEYFTDSEVSEDSYDNTYAFPNPVRPDYTGLVTITKLMSNSNVLITDGDGNIVKRLTSEGGTITWDACDDKGERLPTGTYNVIASQGSVSATDTPVTKIFVIK